MLPAVVTASPQPRHSRPWSHSSTSLDSRAPVVDSMGFDEVGTSFDAQAPGVPPSTWPNSSPRRDVVRLWPEGVPGAIANGGPELLVDGRVSNVHDPTLTVFPAPPDKNTGTAFIVCPGGGYTRLAMEHEGRATAEWLNSLGVSAFVLRYRLKEYGHPSPLRDVLRAVRFLRANAKTWTVATDRIGVIGFSAGGHLAASAGTLFDDPDGRTGAALDATSARPDFMVLIYPVITMSGLNTHSGSAGALFGANATPEMRARLSLESRVTTRTPPTFLVHGGSDTSVPLENSVLFYSALRRAGVPAELHVFQDGAHGVGLQRGHGPMSDWPSRCAEWLAHRGLLTLPSASTPAPAAPPAGSITASPGLVLVTEHVAFRTALDAAGTNVRLTLDVYEPDGNSRAQRPAVLWVHGGGFRPGIDKRQGYIVTLANECARRGYVSIAPDYRVRETPADDRPGTLADAVEDVQAALVWVRDNAARLRIDTSRLVLAGGSAGGKLVVNMAAIEGALDRQGGAQPLAGLIVLWGSPEPSYRGPHPITKLPPTLLIHGTKDVTVPYELSVQLAEELKAQQIPVEFLSLPEAAHTPVDRMPLVIDTVAAFLARVTR